MGLLVLERCVVLARDPDAANRSWRADLTAADTVNRVLERTCVTNANEEFFARIDHLLLARVHQLIEHSCAIGGRLHPHKSRWGNSHGQRVRFGGIGNCHGNMPSRLVFGVFSVLVGIGGGFDPGAACHDRIGRHTIVNL